MIQIQFRILTFYQRSKEISEKVQHFINSYYTDDSNRAGGYYFYAGKTQNR
jgi:hypothetical protein